MLRVSSGFQTLENNKSTRPAASCFHQFSRVWNPMKHSHSFLKYYFQQFCECLQGGPVIMPTRLLNGLKLSQRILMSTQIIIIWDIATNAGKYIIMVGISCPRSRRVLHNGKQHSKERTNRTCYRARQKNTAGQSHLLNKVVFRSFEFWIINIWTNIEGAHGKSS